MAIDKDAWGTRIRDAINAVGVVAGTPVTQAQLEQIWRAIKDEDKTELTTKMEYTHQAGDFNVPATGIVDSVSQPCTGTATNAASGPLKRFS